MAAAQCGAVATVQLAWQAMAQAAASSSSSGRRQLQASGEVVLADQTDDNGVEALCFLVHGDSGETTFILAMIRHFESGIEDGPSRREMLEYEFARDVLRRGAGLRWVPGAARKKPREAENN